MAVKITSLTEGVCAVDEAVDFFSVSARLGKKLGGQVTLGAAVGAGLGTGLRDAAADAMEFTQRAEASDVGPRTFRAASKSS